MKLTLNKKVHTFYTFTAVLKFIQKLDSKEEQNILAEQACGLLEHMHLDFNFIEYYKKAFQPYLIKKSQSTCSNS